MFLFSPVFHLAIYLSIAAAPIWAQRSLSGEAEIRDRLDRLATLGSVMMIGAHPDDENSALIAYFTRGRHMRTAYLSLTRGEGGQNLIGSEQGDELGIIRTQELLAARRIDGAEQYFTRAIDFGFSKTVEDTLAHWPREKVLGDIVWNIRRFRPDVIVLRFSGTPRDGHGHHQLSAILGREAFSAAADPSRFPDQLKWVEPWQAKRLMYNVIAFTSDQEKEARAMKDRVEIDVGQYNPELGFSYSEIGGSSRSLNRSQGDGMPEPKGTQKAYLVTIAGDVAKNDVFDDIATSWSRMAGGADIGAAIDRTRESLDTRHPEKLVASLADLRPRIVALAKSTRDRLAEGKLKEIDEAIDDCAALWLDAVTDRAIVTPGATWKINAAAIARLPEHVVLTGLSLSGMEGAPASEVAPAVLVDNQPSRYTLTVHVPESQPYSQPYWLAEPKDGWLYTVPDPRMIGDAENPPVLAAHFKLKIAGQDLELTRPVRYRYIDHVYGEMTRPIAVVPPVAVNLNGAPEVFGTAQSRTIEIPLKANTGKTAADVRIEAPDGWRVTPESRHFELAGAGQQTTATFEITPPGSDSQGTLRAIAKVGDREIALATEIIDYPHFPIQILFPAAAAKLVRADIRLSSHNIGYVMGAGDEVPDAIRQIGAQVTMLAAQDLLSGDLSRFDAIVTGVRAWNVRPDLRANYQRLFDYVQNGGTLLVQYNTVEGGPFGGDTSLLEHVGPLPITLSRDRVTEEDAAVVLPHPQNPLLHYPNLITPRDFEGWIQERGLSFASEWDPKYESVLESHDKGEEPHPGGELYLKWGKGVYIYSGYSWFRELAAGVPGAYRLFANMLSAGAVSK